MRINIDDYTDIHADRHTYARTYAPKAPTLPAWKAVTWEFQSEVWNPDSINLNRIPRLPYWLVMFPGFGVPEP